MAYLVGGKPEIRKVFRVLSWPRVVLPLVLLLGLVGGWVLYASHYNRVHGSFYFSTTIFPVWQLSKSEVMSVLLQMNDLWMDEYFHYSVIIFFAVLTVFFIFNGKHSHKFIFNAVLIMATEVLAYGMLQFWALADHDYYTIDLFILPMLLLLGSSIVLSQKYPGFFRSGITRFIFLLFFCYNAYHAHGKAGDRYKGWWNDFGKNKDLYTVTPYLRQLGITYSDTVISIPDKSHSSLYLMNQRGWTEYTDARFRRGKPIPFNQDSAGIATSIENGGKYLIINGLNELYSKKYLWSFCTHLLGQYNNILIFDLQGGSQNYSMEKREIDNTYNCDAETLDGSGNRFIHSGDSGSVFENGATQSRDHAKMGSFSCKVDKSQPFGMTLKLKNLEAGESFEIGVWRKPTSQVPGFPVASIPAENQYYNSNFKILEVSADGWEHLSMQFFISHEYAGKELVLYVYNPEKDPTYFDDFKIIRYKSALHSMNQKPK